MPSRPDISVIVSTYQRPGHLHRSLASLACQRGVSGRFEVIVVDDGSQDETAAVVAEFAASVDFRVEFSTHRHQGFQLAKCRNDGVRLAQAPYLLFTDGDCIFPRNHLARHLQAAREGVVRAGDSVRLEDVVSSAIGAEEIASGRFVKMCRRAADWPRIRTARWRAPFYEAMRHPMRPKLVGCNMAVWREQLEAVNGFDENFVGWGCEDDDLAQRLRRAGARIKSVLGRTVAYHLWHPPHDTTPQDWSDGANVDYFLRPARLTRCLAGVERRDIADVVMTVTPGSSGQKLAATALAGLLPSGDVPELEILLGPRGRFRHADACRVLLVNPQDRVPVRLSRQAEAVLRCDTSDREAILGELETLLCGQAPAGESRRAA